MQNSKGNPPVAKKVRKETEIHGYTMVDEYHWIRDKDNPEVIDYLNLENDYTKQMMNHTSPGQERLFNELKGRIKETDESVPVKHGDYYYYSRTIEGQQYSIMCRKKGNLESEEKILLDQNLESEGKEFYRVRMASVSPNHELYAYSVDLTGYEKYTLFVKDLSSGDILDKIEDISGPFQWGDNENLFYTINDKIHRPYIVKQHKLGSSVELDRQLFEESDDTRFVDIGKGLDGKYFFIHSGSITSSEVHFLDLKNVDGDITCFRKREEIEYDLDHHEGYFYITTNENAINFKVMRCKVDEYANISTWNEFIPHRDNVKIDGISTFKDFIMLIKRIDGQKVPEVLDMKNRENSLDIEMPESIYAFYDVPGYNKEYQTDTYRFYYSSLITPETTFDYSVKDKGLEIKKQIEVKNHNPADYETIREFATAKDGTKIPISVVYKKGVSNAPTLLYGYGSYGITVDPTFSPNRLSLLERGMVFAIAHIRGSTFLGRPWYEDGKMLNKHNTFTDFNACAEHLININISKSDELIIQGGSAGGLLMGVCVNMRPDLYRAVVAQVPFVDVMNTMLDASIPLTSHEYSEWGDPNDKKYFNYMLSYSPIDNVKQQNYPRMLVTGGLNDPRVHYWEPTKWVAKLRDMKTDDNLLLLKTNMGAGHGGASGRYDSLKELAFVYSFVFDTLNIDF